MNFVWGIVEMKKSIQRIFAVKSLKKPGGQIYRTIADLPKHMTVEELIEASNALGLGHRIESGVIRFFAPS